MQEAGLRELLLGLTELLLVEARELDDDLVVVAARDAALGNTKAVDAPLDGLDRLTWQLDVSDRYLLTKDFQNTLETHSVVLVPFRSYFHQ